jgi:transcriptional/translational regulatory protein YebC/TACO1
MSGHSKFANIKHKKEKNDAKKGKIFTVIGRELVMAGLSKQAVRIRITIANFVM